MAFQANDFDRAAAAFERAAEGYGASAGTHFQEGVSFANLGSVYLAQGDNPRAEGIFRRALDIYARVLPTDHVNVGIAQAKLGRALLRQRRGREAENALQQAEDILARQPGPESTWLKSTREDLASIRQTDERQPRTRSVTQAAALHAPSLRRRPLRAGPRPCRAAGPGIARASRGMAGRARGNRASAGSSGSACSRRSAC